MFLSLLSQNVIFTKKSIAPYLAVLDFAQFGEPTMQLLMDLVGWKVKNQWRQIGCGLGVEETELQSIQTEEAGKNDQCMRRVFSTWQSTMISPYTWQNLANVLGSPAVMEIAAMCELYRSLCGDRVN